MIDKGSFIRKKNYEFFKNFYLTGKVEYLPAIQVTTIKSYHDGKVTIQGECYTLEDLVEIDECEANLLCREFKAMKLSEANFADLTNTHIRSDTGNVKKTFQLGEALRYVFSFNKKNPYAKLVAYECPECNEIHCGKQPRTLADFVKLTNEQILAEVGIEKYIEISKNIKNMLSCVRHQFPRSIDAQQPRICCNCNTPENAIYAYREMNESI